MTCTKQLRTFVLCALLLGGQQSLHAQGNYEEAPFEEEFKGPKRQFFRNEVNPPLYKGFDSEQGFNFSIYTAMKCYMA